MATADDDVGVETLSLSDEDTGAGSTGGAATPPNGGAAEDRGDNFTPTPGDDDDEGAADGAAAAGAKDGAGADGGRKGVPPERFNEVTAKRKEAEERAAALEAENARMKAELDAIKAKPAAVAETPPAATAPAAATEPPFDLKAKIKEAGDAHLEGDEERFASIMEELFSRAESRGAELAIQRYVSASAEATEASALSAVAATAVAQYPFLDTKTGNPEAIQDVKDMRDLFISRGMRPSEALQQAVAKVAPIYGGKPAPAAGDGGIADARPASAAARGAAISENQPPVNNGGLGERATAGRINVAAMSEKEFAALSEADKKRMRGD